VWRPSQRPGRGEAADRGASEEGGPAAAGPGFFQASLAAYRGVTPAEHRSWRDGVFAQIQAMTHPQGEGSAPHRSIERMCAVAGVSRAGFYRHWGQSEPLRDETALRDALQRIALDKRFYGYRRLKVELGKEGWIVNGKRLLRMMREDNLLCLRKPRFKPATTNGGTTGRSGPIWPRKSNRRRSISCGWPTSHMSDSPRPSCIWRWSWTPTAARWSAGPWPITCAPAWPSTP
jgi:hypothetical protein